MIPVAPDHASHVVHGNILPGLVADVLPAGDLFQNQKAQFIARVEKMRRLGIMRGARNVQLEFFLQDAGVTSLHASRHRSAYPGKRLMAIQPAKLYYLAVQFEPAFGETGLPKAYAPAVFVDRGIALLDARDYRVEIRVRQIPTLDGTEVCQFDLA